MPDALGNDITKVAVPVTGGIGLAPIDTTLPTPVEGADPDFKLPATFKRLGLITEDGGPQWTWEPDGDAIVFWQDGYKIPTGMANVQLVVKAAQTDDFVRSIIYGKEADSNGFILVDGGGHLTQYVVYTEEVFMNRDIRRRVAGIVMVESVAEDRSTRGEVLGYEITFNVLRSPALANHHFGEWLIPAPVVTP